jgi:hypothetical protein
VVCYGEGVLSEMAMLRQLGACPGTKGNLVIRLRRFLGGKRFMRRATCCLLVSLLGSWLSSFGQTAPKFATPRIVATFERLGQTAEIAPTIIYTPKKWGTFRISIVMVLTETNGFHHNFWTGHVSFKDGAGENAPYFPNDDANLYADLLETGGSEFPLRAAAGKPIKFSVTSEGTTSGTKYNVWVVVEQLM